MSAKIISGRTVRDSIIPALKDVVSKLPFVPTLLIIQVGDRADSTTFIEAKKKFARKIGIKEKHLNLTDSISEKELIYTIRKYNTDQSIQGIIVQLPLPAHLNQDKIIGTIEPKKDVDGLTSGALVMPATARGIRELFKYYQISLASKKVTVIGRSKLVGTPIAHMCRAEGAIVTVCHSQTIDLAKETLAADIVIVAVGKPGIIRKEHVREGQVIIDVGINKTADGLVGDVDFQAVKDIVEGITPVPGGVGPMTVCALFENVVDICKICI